MLPTLFADIQSVIEQLKNLIPDEIRNTIASIVDREFITNQLLPAIAVFWVGKLFLRIGVKILTRALRRFQVDETLAKFASKLAYYAGFVLIMISSADQLGVPTANLTAIVAASGLAIGLALKDSLSNFASGVMIIMFRPFEVNDVVEVAGTKGSVEAIHVFNTLLNSPDNVKTFVPNGAIMAGNITNYSRERFRRVDLEIGCGYGDDLPRVKRFLELTVENHPLVLSDPAPVVAVSELAASCVTFVVRPWVANADYWKVRWDLTEQIKLGFDANGFEIPFPQQAIHVMKSEMPYIATDHGRDEVLPTAEKFPISPRRVA